MELGHDAAAGKAAATFVLVLTFGLSSAQAGEPAPSAYQVLHSFDYEHDSGDGWRPIGKLVEPGNGWLYGVTFNGGSEENLGLIYRIQANGAYEVVHAFSSAGSSPSQPGAGLAANSNGWLYGTTVNGGYYQNGTVYRFDTASGATEMLHSFQAPNSGNSPSALILASDGYYYGTSPTGGSFNSGFAYRISPKGAFRAIHDFGASGDGRFPSAQLVQGSDGFLYGTTMLGGSVGVGTIFQMNAKGKTRVLHSFTGGAGGYGSRSELTEGPDGYFWGITFGGSNDSLLIYKVNAKGKFLAVHSFKPDSPGDPTGLMLASDGAFYGAVHNSSKTPVGWLFKTLPSGKTTTLHVFDGVGDGRFPAGALLQSKDGLLYGVTDLGGEFGDHGFGGTVYSVSLP